MKRVLLTGATGFVGQQCLSVLGGRPFEIHAVSSSPFSETEETVRWHCVDLLKTRDAVELVAQVRPSYLLHTAWYTAPGKWANSLENLLWVQASLDLLREFFDQGGERAVFVGSNAEYDSRYGYCSEVLTPKRPSTFYGVCKNALRDLAIGYCELRGHSFSWGILFDLYGPNENPARLVPSVIISLLQGKSALCSSGHQVRDYLYVSDASEALVALLESTISGPINIASGSPIAVREIVSRIGDKLGQNHLIQMGALPAVNEPPLLVGDVSKIKKELGWQPLTSLDHGLERSIGWWKQNYLPLAT